MMTKSTNSFVEKSTQQGVLASSKLDRQSISPAERWLLIAEKAYCRVQRRGFVGGDPFKDWLAAEQEVDAIYAADSQGFLLQADAERLVNQVKNMFGGYGLGHLNLATILEKHRAVLQLLAEHNSKLIDGTSALVAQQAAVFQDAVSEAVETLHSFTQGKVSADGFTKQAELTLHAMENVLTYFKDLTDAVTDISPLPKQDADGR